MFVGCSTGPTQYRRPSTKMASLSKWKGFSMWSLACGVQLILASIQAILECFLHLQLLGLPVSLLREYLVVTFIHPFVENWCFPVLDV